MEGRNDEIYIRRALPDDEESIISLIGEDSYLNRKRFGPYTVIQLIETNFLSMVAVDGSGGDLVGFASFHHSPLDNQDSIPVNTWGEFMRTHYRRCPYNTQNTLWMTFFHSDPIARDQVRDELFRTLFTTFPLVHYVLFHFQRRAFPAMFFPVRDLFIELKEREDRQEERDVTMCVLTRQSYVPRLRVRHGRVEDNDDLQPLLLQTPNLTTFDMSGEFQLANLLQNQDDNHKFIVGEHDGHLVGLLYLSTCTMNVEELLDNFNLQGYQNLIAEDSETSTFNQDTDFRINAFQVTAFFVFPEFMDRSVDLLEAAFRLFPGRTYCIVSLPFISQQHPLLDSFNAIRMNPNCISSEGLYIADRSAFFDPLLARIASPEDLQRVTNLFPDSERVFDNCNSERNETLQTVVMYNGIDGNIVGCAVIDNTVDLTMLRRQFHVDKLVRTSQHPSNRCGLVKKFHLMPQYISSANNILMHVMHISQKTMLLYGTQSESSINPVLDRHLIHLDPKRPIQIPSAVSKASTTPDSDKGAFQQLYATTVRYLSEPKTEVNHRIVVVGGSKTGLSFIHTLISVPYLYFNNITLLTLDKEEHIDEMEDDIGMEMMESFAEDDEYLERRDLDTVSRRPNISVIGGRLRDFDRQQKIAITYSNAEIHFDMLVLATSRPYRVPSSLKNSEAPVDGIIDLDKSHLCLEAISRHVGNDNRLSQIVVYGSSLDAFCTVNMLIAGLRVNPERIMLISPNGKLSALGDDVLEEKVNAVLDALDVKHYNHYSIDNFEYNDEGQLCNVWFSNTPYIEEQRERLQKEAEHAGTDENGAADRRQKLLEEMKNINKEVFDVNCHLLINCQYQDVDPGLLEAIHHQALVFDGRLIVDPEFKTTDSDIFAAGPLAKFSRRYGPSDHMENFNTWEVGQKMARSVMQSLGIEPSDNSEFELPAVDNMGEGHSAKNDKASLPEKRLPTFQNTVTRRCVLPGRNHFLQIRLPSHNPGKCRVIRTAHPPLEVINSSEDSKKLVVSHRQRYTCIMVNRVTGIIENVTYYGKEPIEEHNLRSIVGLPASYCNDMVGRFDEGLVECFVDFLRQHWAMALFCDRFSQFRERLLRQIEDVEDVVKFAEQLLHIVTKKEPTVPSAATGGDIGASSQGLLLAHERLTSTTRQYIERELLKFIHEYQEELGEIPSVYHIPTFK